MGSPKYMPTGPAEARDNAGPGMRVPWEERRLAPWHMRTRAVKSLQARLQA